MERGMATVVEYATSALPDVLKQAPRHLMNAGGTRVNYRQNVVLPRLAV